MSMLGRRMIDLRLDSVDGLLSCRWVVILGDRSVDLAFERLLEPSVESRRSTVGFVTEGERGTGNASLFFTCSSIDEIRCLTDILGAFASPLLNNRSWR